jgi:hypothetical protein
MTPFKRIAERYIEILNKSHSIGCIERKTNSGHLINMLKAGISNEEIWPVEKLYNWLGYVSGVMTENKLIDVDTERDFSRPLYHQYYRKTNREIPETLNLTEGNLQCNLDHTQKTI